MNAATKVRPSEALRLETLCSYGILDTPREREFDDIAQMAAQACGTPIAYINFIDADRQWYKAEVGLGVEELPRTPSICVRALDEQDMLLLPDLTRDPEFADSVFVIGPLQARFYAGVPLRSPDGLPIGTLCVIDRVPRDLSEQQLFILKALARSVMAQLEMRRAIAGREQAETALRESNHTLEERIQQALVEREGIEAALRQAQKMEAVGQLTGGVAHDFNNLLTVIRSSVDLLARPDLPEARRTRYLAAINETVARAAKLTSQLLAFARRQALQPKVFDVGQSVGLLIDMVGTLSGTRIRVVTAVPDQPSCVHADPSQLDTALVNLVLNARDAMRGEGELSITVASSQGIPEAPGHSAVLGAFITLAVRDTGCGIAPAHLEKIFEPFFTTKPVGHGTGLGLSQVYGFAKQSGGEVRVTSDVGFGTTLTVYLPQVAAATEAVPGTPTATAPSARPSTRVLVVEDHADIGRFVTQALAEIGYEPTLAEHGEAAWTLLADGAVFDVVFTDVMMPGMNGIELAKRIRSHWPALPVLLTSGYSQELAQDGTGGFELLHKPYAIGEVAERLAQAVDRTLAA